MQSSEVQYMHRISHNSNHCRDSIPLYSVRHKGKYLRLKISKKIQTKISQDKTRIEELNQECVEKGYYNKDTKMKLKCKYIETSGGKFKNLEITTMPKGTVWAGMLNLNSGKYSLIFQKCDIISYCFSRRNWSDEPYKKGSQTCS